MKCGTTYNASDFDVFCFYAPSFEALWVFSIAAVHVCIYFCQQNLVTTNWIDVKFGKELQHRELYCVCEFQARLTSTSLLTASVSHGHIIFISMTTVAAFLGFLVIACLLSAPLIKCYI